MKREFLDFESIKKEVEKTQSLECLYRNEWTCLDEYQRDVLREIIGIRTPLTVAQKDIDESWEDWRP